jgi:hypothetical protein
MIAALDFLVETSVIAGPRHPDVFQCSIPVADFDDLAPSGRSGNSIASVGRAAVP